ncbi:hypothetical protein HNP55_003544 [Paucibacter oligotrophus]|uniref:Uncharacterized protein n=1 Tax=Roseateles oligotrophus TaxID=1769250 RepID=A0A840LFK9_9BURK|nr:hypothetical protein [Roseateles oligotrophus]MBB4844998.1 hypothetical protein [Roseateles oligotrophus]
MTIELWHLVLLLLSFFGACGAVAKMLLRDLNENHRQLQARLDGLERNHREESGQWQRIERELLNLKAELPLHYVRREDYVQAVATIGAKLDAMAIRFENILLKGGNRES